ncbi:MAG TPA: penicillin-insensitive murein endopeptidase [Solirubrobacteraceae bacterium]|nr:penicillin-insensitive murein endopeptidase [Solirubrobacteraceae bacterium]
MRFALPLLILLALALPAVLLAAQRDRPPDPPPVRVPPIATATPAPLPPVATPPPVPEPAPARPSRAVGLPYDGRLVRGRQLAGTGPGWATWDPIRKRVGNRGWRRWGTGRLLFVLHTVLGDYARRHPDAQPVLVGDLSRPRGGDFGPRFGGIGHASHQNGLDADVYYPRLDGRLRRPFRPDQVDRAAAQQLVDAFVRAGARYVFVGPSLGLRGPRGVVEPLVNHDDHLHVRLRG